MIEYADKITEMIYLIGTVLFVVGLKKMSNVKTARSGNTIGAVGMALGILVILFIPLNNTSNSYFFIFGALIVGAVIGYIASVKVALTSMPEMVSLFNGLGGGCSMFIGFTEVYKMINRLSVGSSLSMLTGIFAIVVGAVTLTGSLVAWGKLSGKISDKLKLPFPQVFNIIVMISCVTLGIILMQSQEPSVYFVWLLLVVSMVYGFTFVLPIGGGDMPVVISLLNSLSGIAAAISGLLYQNNFMIIGGILVGASGTILSLLMCTAMNRSLFNVLLGGFGTSGVASSEDGDKTVSEITYSDLAVQLKYAGKVILVPGYGLAMAQAQHACYELEKALEAEGVQFYYGIHPVAGRMPGHMNVLLAEAQVPYDKLLELEPSNEQFDSTDIVLVIGANDVVNPAAKENPGSPIYGMPILDTERAKMTVVFKRSMNPGYAGIENPLFFKEKTKMLFGDAKDSLSKIKSELANF